MDLCPRQRRDKAPYLLPRATARHSFYYLRKKMAEIKKATSCRTCKYGVFKTLSSSAPLNGLCTLNHEGELPKWPSRTKSIGPRTFEIWRVTYRFEKGKALPKARDIWSSGYSWQTKTYSEVLKKLYTELQEWIDEIAVLAQVLHAGLQSGSIRTSHSSATCDDYQAKKTKASPSLKKCLEGTNRWADDTVVKTIAEACWEKE